MEIEKDKKSGTCQKCGKHTDNLQLAYNATTELPFHVCPKCNEEIERFNQLSAKAALVGCGVSVLVLFLILLVALIVSLC